MIRPSFAFSFALALLAEGAFAQEPLDTVDEMVRSRTDLWGEAAIRRPEGPSFEFFRDLLPPLRYVNTAFRHYPIVLAAPQGAVKARWVSNGSGVNLRADKPPMWKEIGTPVRFLVGDSREPFGLDVTKLDGPRCAEGFLPIVQVGYTHEEAVYTQEAFGSVREDWAAHGAVCVRFTAARKPGRVTVRIESEEELSAAAGALVNSRGEAIIRFGAGWNWEQAGQTLTTRLNENQSAELIAFTRPAAFAPENSVAYDDERAACVAAWKAILDQGTELHIPETIVQNAWRALVIGNFLIADGDRMNYSAGNAYDHLYEAECGDAVRSLMLLGHGAAAREMVGPLLDFHRQATRFHVAGHKLQLLAHYYWVTRDGEYVRQKRPAWEPAVQLIRDSRRTDNGLLPQDNYAGDVKTQVYSLNSNANCWRGLRDMAAVLDDLGEHAAAAEWKQEAAAYRQAILAAVAQSEDREARFIPVALLGDEPPHDPLTATRMGSYYDLMIPYVLGSSVFGPGDPREGWIIDYLRHHGGLAMGMIRSMPHQGEFNGQAGVNVLYGLRYNLCLLRRGDRKHAQTAFYGQLAQGMTRDTFIGGEGSRFLHGDPFGRSFYLPPNSASNAAFLTTLRYLLIQDWDLNDDGVPETLRLCDAIPSRWLADGTPIVVRNAPTAFGEVSFRIEPRLSQGEILAEVESPPRPVGKWLLRLPDPPGYAIAHVLVGNEELSRDADGRVDLTGRRGAFPVRFQLRPLGQR